MKSAIKLRKLLQQKFHKQFDFEIHAGNRVALTIISEQFQGKTRAERCAMVEPYITESGLVTGVLELLNPDEAETDNVSLSSHSENQPPISWQQAINMLYSGKTLDTKKRKHPIKRVVFYSYKGGVGRTTALIQTAFQLTRAGKRVAIIDMDVEAPGLHTLLPPSDLPITDGIVDYFWERQTCIFSDEQPATVQLRGQQQNQRTSIVYSVNDPQSRRDLYIIPAGKVGQRYVQRLSVLSTTHLFNLQEEPWQQFEQELWQQYEPDILLIDARTGLNEWGGLSLLRLADEAFIVLYPSKQNSEGVCFVRDLLKELGGVQAKLVISPIPEGFIGDTLIKEIKPYLQLKEDEEPILIPYHPNIAGSRQFPVETALPYYAPLANTILEVAGKEETETLLAEYDRLALIKSLNFPQRDAASISDAYFDTIFQKTADFERCLDDQVWVIRGRKGTGKSTLYTLFTKHRENAEKRSRGRLDNVIILSGHGNSNEFCPKTDVFSDIQKQLQKKNSDWLSLWRAYAIIHIYQSYPDFSQILNKAKLTSLVTKLNYNFGTEKKTYWNSTHTTKLIELATDMRLNGYCRDAISLLNNYLKEQNQKLWLLYDDLDQDIKENSAWQAEALGGLMRFVYDTNNQYMFNVRFKVFLREDIWHKLIFTNKSHFGEERALTLQWRKEDFLRLAYRLATAGSEKFKTFVNRIQPLADNELDELNEDVLRNALSSLWGLNTQKNKNAYVAQWVFSRLTDASGNTYPRSLTIFLKKAQEVELTQNQSKNAPPNHLLRWTSLTAGLEEASKERCEAIKNEYPELSAFFDKANELKSLLREEELKEFWQQHIANQDTAMTYEIFIKLLKDIGLLGIKKYSEYQYVIADLYVYGFNIGRKQGQRK